MITTRAVESEDPFAGGWTGQRHGDEVWRREQATHEDTHDTLNPHTHTVQVLCVAAFPAAPVVHATSDVRQYRKRLSLSWGAKLYCVQVRGRHTTGAWSESVFRRQHTNRGVPCFLGTDTVIFQTTLSITTTLINISLSSELSVRFPRVRCVHLLVTVPSLFLSRHRPSEHLFRPFFNTMNCQTISTARQAQREVANTKRQARRDAREASSEHSAQVEAERRGALSRQDASFPALNQLDIHGMTLEDLLHYNYELYEKDEANEPLIDAVVGAIIGRIELPELLEWEIQRSAQMTREEMLNEVEPFLEGLACSIPEQ